MTQLPMHDGEPFIRKLEEAQAAGDLDFVGDNLPQPERLIGLFIDRIHEQNQLEYRARLVRESHEPAAR